MTYTTNIADKSVYEKIQKALKEKFLSETIGDDLIRYYTREEDLITVVAVEDEIKETILLYIEDDISYGQSKNRYFNYIGLSIARNFTVIEDGKKIKNISCFALGKLNSRKNYIELIQERGFVFKNKSNLMENYNSHRNLGIDFSYIDTYIDQINGRVYIKIPWADLYLSFDGSIKRNEFWKKKCIDYFEIQENEVYEEAEFIDFDLEKLKAEVDNESSVKSHSTFDEETIKYFTENNNFCNKNFALLDGKGMEFEEELLNGFSNKISNYHASFKMALNKFSKNVVSFRNKLLTASNSIDEDLLLFQKKNNELNDIYINVSNKEKRYDNMTKDEIFNLGRKSSMIEQELKKIKNDIEKVNKSMRFEFLSLFQEYNDINDRVQLILNIIEEKEEEILSMEYYSEFWISFCSNLPLKFTVDINRLVTIESYMSELNQIIDEILRKKDFIVTFFDID